MEQRATVDGVCINYVVVGKGAKNVLLLPGTLGTWQTDFERTLSDLDGDKFTMVCWDPPGYGKSRPPDRVYDTDTNARDAALALKLMAQLQLTPFAAVGWSEGGRTALFMARESPEHVERLVQWGAICFVTKQLYDYFQVVDDAEDWPAETRKVFLKHYDKDYLKSTWHGQCAFYSRVFKDVPMGSLCRNILAKIRQPVLILQAEKDALVETNANFMNKRLSNSRLITCKDAGHDMHKTHADWFNRTLRDFLLDDQTLNAK